jgi:hypothetical protein
MLCKGKGEDAGVRTSVYISVVEMQRSSSEQQLRWDLAPLDDHKCSNLQPREDGLLARLCMVCMPIGVARLSRLRINR